MSQPAFAGVDWGTTRFRAWLLAADGEVLAERRADDGLLATERDRFGDVLEGHLAAMGADAALPVLACGMVGSRQGWVEVPYVDVPAKLTDVAAKAVRVPGTKRDIRIMPGMAQRDPSQPDVMRGEETQLAGVAGLHGGDTLVCMPGTHCKWVELRDGSVSRFTTWLTGELYSLLAAQSILRHSIGTAGATVEAGDSMFAKWLDDGLAHPGDATSRLFRIRASTLLFDLKPAEAAAALSGLLIGSEVASAKAHFDAAGRTVTLVVSGKIGALYVEALQRAGLKATLIDAERTVRLGLMEAARTVFGTAGGGAKS